MFSRACAYISNSLNYTCLLSSHFSFAFAFCKHTEKKWFPILIKGIRASNYEQKIDQIAFFSPLFLWIYWPFLYYYYFFSEIRLVVVYVVSTSVARISCGNQRNEKHHQHHHLIMIEHKEQAKSLNSIEKNTRNHLLVGMDSDDGEIFYITQRLFAINLWSNIGTCASQ